MHKGVWTVVAATSIAVLMYALLSNNRNLRGTAPAPATAGTLGDPAQAMERSSGTSSTATGGATTLAARTMESSPFQVEQRRSFDREADLYRLAVDAAHSADPNLWGQGYAAAASCMATKPTRAQLVEMSEMRPDVPAPAERASAARSLLERCHAFFMNDDIANLALRRRIADNVRAGREYVAGVSTGPITSAQFRAVLARQDQLTFEKVFVDIQGPAMRANAVQEGGTQAAAFALGFMLAQCDLGRNCSSDSLTYLQLCASEGKCDGSLERFYTHGAPQEILVKAAYYRHQIAEAYRQKNAGYFGSGQ